jgi:hypothetical protein
MTKRIEFWSAIVGTVLLSGCGSGPPEPADAPSDFNAELQLERQRRAEKTNRDFERDVKNHHSEIEDTFKREQALREEANNTPLGRALDKGKN